MPKTKTKKSNKERWQYSNCILDVREKLMLNLVSANEFPDLCVSSLNYKHTAYLGGLWSPSKPSCWEMWISFSFWRSQSRYPISRGCKSRNIWYSSKWKHLHCHLFSFPLLNCWMWITQQPPNMPVMAVCSWRAQSCKSDVRTCCSGNKTCSLQRPLECGVCISHAAPCQSSPLGWKTLENHFPPGFTLLS